MCLKTEVFEKKFSMQLNRRQASGENGRVKQEVKEVRTPSKESKVATSAVVCVTLTFSIRVSI